MPGLFVYQPSKESDLVNMIYAALTLKLRDLKVSPEAEPVVHLGKSHKPDLVIEDQVAIEVKLAKSRDAAAKAIVQAEMYRKGGYPAAIAVIYPLIEYDVERKQLEKLASNRVYVVIL